VAAPFVTAKSCSADDGVLPGSQLTRRANQQKPVKPLMQKYSVFPKWQITLYPRLSTPLEGRIAIVTDAGLDAMDAGGA
jgi:hypothetical protein